MAPDLQAMGIGVAGITYDSPEQQSRFVAKYDISYPVLSDVDSVVIRQLEILNTEIPPDLKYFGAPYPGIYLLDAEKRVVAKFAEEDYRDRPLLSDVLNATEELP